MTMRITLLVIIVTSSAVATVALRLLFSSNDTQFARLLVNESTWGVLNTLNDSTGMPFGNVMSFSDGGTGVPYFFLTTTLDPTGGFAVKDSRSSFTLSEYALGSCALTTDPQSPICSKITLSGNLVLLPKVSEEARSGKKFLFRDHPHFKGFPSNPKNGFEVFKMEIKSIFLINEFAPAKYVTVADYLNVKI